MEEFMECDDVEEFKMLVSDDNSYPMSALWLCAQTLWVHLQIFGLLDANNTQGARKLAIDIIRALPFDSPTTHFVSSISNM
jgi:hypothetical protein